ncbi:glucose-6-phosphate isomerase Pgi [Peptoclostridium acidaminophilum DSM 3953]|uniref:Glucose-6-phosphate isomerase n=1 Tax=Peptoclostridium acidaminophilum DSM 3953 TaxID=1286171 RepID=W8T574_PEPAC|nr:glucose-6-phosphate isomerase [Peptoclostridium acidaminophilum]AHM56909.1 glucose-6-phosphate isomerase Pgi [Peptoclostridium acidaminophilum DSM 3953]
MIGFKLDCRGIEKFVTEDEVRCMEPFVNAAHEMIHEKSGPGADFLGWLELPGAIKASEIEEIKETARQISGKCDILVVVGIGGSYLGAKAAIEMLTGYFGNFASKRAGKSPRVVFAGNNISSTYLKELSELLEESDFCINVISKSGTTTEPAVAFRVLKGLLEKKYGKEEAASRIIATTDSEKGSLRKLADSSGYKTFVIPEDVGGRYSVLTPVGLLPMCVAGIDIDKVIEGARKAQELLSEKELSRNDAYRYAAIRNILYNKGMLVELLVSYEPHLTSIGEWWKQLFGESEGKDGKGIYPSSASFSTDLHSLGQYIQQGRRMLFETVLNVKSPRHDVSVVADPGNLDGLDYLEGVEIDYINKKAMEGTMLAHIDGGVPNMIIDIPGLDEYSFGYMVYFFEKACAMSAYLLGVNPFDQPGVEEYKRNMFALLGKPGHEEQRQKMLGRL